MFMYRRRCCCCCSLAKLLDGVIYGENTTFIDLISSHHRRDFWLAYEYKICQYATVTETAARMALALLSLLSSHSSVSSSLKKR